MRGWYPSGNAGCARTMGLCIATCGCAGMMGPGRGQGRAGCAGMIALGGATGCEGAKGTGETDGADFDAIWRFDPLEATDDAPLPIVSPLGRKRQRIIGEAVRSLDIGGASPKKDAPWRRYMSQTSYRLTKLWGCLIHGLGPDRWEAQAAPTVHRRTLVGSERAL